MTAVAALARPYWAPKSAGVRAEWEDGFAYSEPDGRFAVSDGATWASESRRWAQELSRAFVHNSAKAHAIDRDLFAVWVNELRSGFADRAGVPNGRAEDGWWAEEVASRGAAAAFVGLHLDLSSGAWASIAVGDCCLFHFSGQGSRSFPLAHPDEFSSSPILIGTSGPVPSDQIRATGGVAAPGDLFVLASDAIASWIVGEIAAGRDPGPTLAGVRSENFGHLVRELRGSQRIPDDDVTLLRIHVVSGGTP